MGDISDFYSIPVRINSRLSAAPLAVLAYLLFPSAAATGGDDEDQNR
jgi:uncharacterized membrane protein